MGVTVAVMITKGGVGKSTLVMALAETLSVFHAKRILIIDSDSQSSISAMLMPGRRLRDIQENGETLARYLREAVLGGRYPDWRPYVVERVSDVDDAQTVSLLPSHVELALLERDVSAQLRLPVLGRVVAGLVSAVNAQYDLVLVDCPPALTALTEAWMQQADYHLSPTKPDYLGVHGLEVLRRFEGLSAEHSFSRRLGVVVNMMDASSPVDRKFYEALTGDPRHGCFSQAIPDHASVRHAAVYFPETRSFTAKYPGIGPALRGLAEEVLARLDRAAAAGAASPPALSSRTG